MIAIERSGSDRADHAASDEVGTTWDRAVALGQGVFYLATGLWPILSLRTFEAVTGPKVDGWLVKTAGVLITAIGAAVTCAGLRNRVTPEIKLLATGSAAGLAAIDVLYVSRGRIPPVYLLDAVAEVGLIGGWLVAQAAGRRRRSIADLDGPGPVIAPG